TPIRRNNAMLKR
ncbi:hypothetical protein HPMKF8_0990, partial [Helicobacter pylori]